MKDKTMLASISLKEFDPDGQLDKINILPCAAFIPSRFGMQDRPSTRIDWRNFFLVCNQFYYLNSLVELASLNLINSSGNDAEIIAKTFYAVEGKKLENRKESISIDFLLSSIIFFNSSFDYLKVFIKYTYSTYEELITEYPQEQIEEAMKKLHLKDDWWLALAYCINMVDINIYMKWFEKSHALQNIKKLFVILREQNGRLRKKYQANSLKHCALPYFQRSNLSNKMGKLLIESLKQYYSKKESTSNIYHLGSLDSIFRIVDMQNFLIEYHNYTAKVINEIVNDIGLNENEEEGKLIEGK